MESCDAAMGPKLPTLADLKEHLREEPLYFQVLENYLRNTAQLVEDLRRRLRSNERDAHEEMEIAEAELIVSASPPPSRGQPEAFQEHQEELKRDRQLNILLEKKGEDIAKENLEEEEEEENREGILENQEMAEWRQVSHEPLVNEEMMAHVTQRAQLTAPERREEGAVREIVLRSRTIRVPAVGGSTKPVSAKQIPTAPEIYDVPGVEELPERYRQLLVLPRFDPYFVIRKDDGSTTIKCSFCAKEFGSLKGWRIHAAKIHTQIRFCQKCGYFVDMPNAISAEEITATMELHSMEWCTRATKADISQRAAKRRRLQLAGRSEEAEHYFIPSAQK
uniref:C2H2-type domain-containing protein n=1 Tax=Setaria digitata TaxID=48799 RepID=A0A915PK91_9BILA